MNPANPDIDHAVKSRLILPAPSIWASFKTDLILCKYLRYLVKCLRISYNLKILQTNQFNSFKLMNIIYIWVALKQVRFS